jgi:hypothetical protein
MEASPLSARDTVAAVVFNSRAITASVTFMLMAKQVYKLRNRLRKIKLIFIPDKIFFASGMAGSGIKHWKSIFLRTAATCF